MRYYWDISLNIGSKENASNDRQFEWIADLAWISMTIENAQEEKSLVHRRHCPFEQQ